MTDDTQTDLFRQQTQHSAPLNGEVLAPDRITPELSPMEEISSLVLFDDADVVQALKIFDASEKTDRHLAMREVLLFALRVATINLEVHPDPDDKPEPLAHSPEPLAPYAHTLGPRLDADD